MLLLSFSLHSKKEGKKCVFSSVARTLEGGYTNSPPNGE